MKAIVPIFVAVTCGVLATGTPSAVRAGQTTSRATLGGLPTSEPPKPITGTIICRGGPALRWETAREIEDLTRAPSKAKRMVVGLIFQISQGPAGPQGLGLKQDSQCGFVDRPWPKEYSPPVVYFDAASAEFDIKSGTAGVYSRRSSIQEYLTDINHFWSFDVVLKSYYFDSDTHKRFDTKSSGAMQVPILTEAGNAPGNVMAKTTAQQAGAKQPGSGNATAGNSGAASASSTNASATIEPAKGTAAVARAAADESRGATPADPTPVVPAATAPTPTAPASPTPAPPPHPASSTAPPASPPFSPPVATASSTEAVREAQPATAPAPYNADDRGIIVVGDKKMTPAQAQREIRGELQRSNGPVRTVTATRKATATRSAPAQLSNSGTTLNQVPGRFPATAQPIGGRLPGAERAATLKMDCTNNPPRISHIQGAVTPGGQFTINGACFGTQTGGYVEIIGQFPGGTLKRQSVNWQDHAIVVEMPSLTHIPSHTVAISVRRGVDAKQSTARHAQFVAARHRVAVPAGMWSPSGHFVADDDVARASGNAVTGWTSFSKGYVEQRTTDFRLRVNPACALETLDVPATIGRVVAINGWENGQANEANVRVVWSPACKIHTKDYVVAAEHKKFCSVAFDLKAHASCPAGVAP